MKIIIPPDEYYAEVLLRAALHFFDVKIFRGEHRRAAVRDHGVMVFSSWYFRGPHRTERTSTPRRLSLVLLSTYWFWFDHSIHASSRYYLRTALVIVTPIFGAIAALLAIYEDGRLAFCQRARTA